ncbi:MAG TPA: ABC transporter permease subunit [Pirellulaceae bacterium]|nr:ABC transporter permease subunit [Pirellulaceae bacterium]
MKKILVYILISFTVIGLWEYYGGTNTVVRLYISSPGLIIEYIANNHAELLRAVLTTFVQASTGLMLAILISFAVMIICFIKPKLIDYVLPVMIISQVIPVIVLAPFFILVLGIGMSSKIAMAAVISFFPVFISFVQGYKAISPNIHELMLLYNAPLKFRILRTYFPLAMPSFMAGMKVSATLAVIGAIVAEFTGARYGIGKNLFVSAIRLDPDLMMSSLILASLMGLTLYAIVISIERKYGTWYLNK